MQRTLDRAERFLALVALLAAMVAAVAVGAAARRFSLRHLDSCAMMRCLGLAQSDQIFRLFGLEFGVIGLMACIAGVMLGYAAHYALLQALGTLIKTVLPQPTLVPAVQGLACGLVLLLGFALLPLAQLRHVPPLRVLRKDVGLPTGRVAFGYLAGLSGFVALLLWSSNDLKIGGLTAGGFAGGVRVFALVAWGALKSLAPLRALTGKLGISWRFAVAAVQRRPVPTIVQLVSIAIGLMALLLLTVTRTDLVDAWRAAAPPDAPNRFVINIQPDQVAAVEGRLRAAGIDAPLHPMIRGRLVQVNGRAVGPESYTGDRAQRLVDREFNLSYVAERPSHNPITAGNWFKDGSDELSIEEGIAKTLDIKLGDSLTFEIAGRNVTARATSLRKVNWDSMRANFFVIMPPSLLADQPASFITAFHLSNARASLTGELLKEFPNLTVVDTTAVFRQVQSVIDQVIAAVEFLFVFTLVAGILVLYSALASSREERVREAGLLRALGASRIADEIRGKLTTLPGLEVIARGSSTPYAKSPKSPAEIARELSVRYLLTPTVRWEKGDGRSRVKVSPELLEISGPSAPAVRWQQAFDAELTDVFRVQSDIPTRVALALGVALGTGEEKRLLSRPTQSLPAYEAFLRGEEASKGLGVGDPPALRKAISHYEEAVALDPAFAQAWARLGRASVLLYANTTPEPALARRALEAAERAVKLAPDRPEGYGALGAYQASVENDYRRALEYYAEGERRAPSDPDLLSSAASAEMRLGRWKAALDHLSEPERLDPRSVRTKRTLGFVLLYLRFYRDAREVCDRGLEIATANLALLEWKAMTFLAEGDLLGARGVIKAVPPAMEPAALVAFFATYQDLVWVLTADQHDLLLRLTPAAFDEHRGAWGAPVISETPHWQVTGSLFERETPPWPKFSLGTSLRMMCTRSCGI